MKKLIFVLCLVLCLIAMKKVIIVGAGVIGQFTAYFLAKNSKKQRKIMLIDENSKMPATSYGNCGLVTPSHIHPMNSWQTSFQGLKWLGKKDAPLYIKPQWNLDFFTWLASFVLHSKSASVKKAITARQALLELSHGLYEEFFSSKKNDSEWNDNGLLYACHSKATLKQIHAEVKALQTRGFHVEALSKDKLLLKEPLLKANTLGGALYHCDAWLNPATLMQKLRESNIANNVEYIEDKINSIHFSQGRIQELCSENTSYTADEYVLASGAKTLKLIKALGINMKMLPAKGYNLSYYGNFAEKPKRPIFLYDAKVVATPWRAGFRLGSTLELSGFNLNLDEGRLNALKKAASTCLNMDIEKLKFKPWTGWRPMNSHDIPSIGRHKKFSNLSIGSGHGSLGLSMAPATGLLLSSLLLGETLPISLHDYSI